MKKSTATSLHTIHERVTQIILIICCEMFQMGANFLCITTQDYKLAN